MKKIIFLLTMLMSALTFAQPATGQNDPPPRDAADVVSFYNGIMTPMGDDYVNVAGVVFDTFGSAVTIADATLADGNIVKQYTNHNFSGIGSGSYDVSQMEMLHIDVYFENAPGDFRIKLEDTSVAATEISVDGAAPTGTWLSYDIDLTLFTAPNLANLRWIVPVTTAANTNFYFDNIYFWKAPILPGSDATLSDLQVDGATIAGFSPTLTEYNVELSPDTTVIPQITSAIAADANATSVTINQATALPGDATVVVVSANGMVTETYTVSFLLVGPPTAAPNPPARDAVDVISLFSDAYSDIVVDTFDTPWCPGTTTEVVVDSNPTKLVEGLGCEGVDFQSGRFDATEFTHFHMDIYADAATMDRVFNVKFSNWNGGGGEANALEYSVNNSNFLTNPNPGTWISLDIPLADFTAINNADRNDIVQFIISSDLGTVYYDNLYLYKEPFVAGPATAAPTPPARNAEDVVSLFSDSYANITVDTFDTPWCPGTTTDVLVDGNPTKLVEGLGCEGVDFQSSRFDATEFTNLHMDIFTESETLDKSFTIKLSNWNGGSGEANAIEYAVTNANFLTTPNPGTWISLDIPLDDFTAITNADRNDIVQFIISSDLGTVYYDNLYLWKGASVSGPSIAAPTPPDRNPADVISLFSDAYTDIVIDTFDTPWCPGTTTEVLIASNPTKLVEGLGCEGVEFITGRFDATQFTNFHMDFYTDSDTADKSFNVKFSNWNGGGGEANALEFSVNNSNFLPNPNGGGWISLDIPLDDFASIINGDRNDIVQFVISSDLGTVYYDNLYLWKDGAVTTPVELPVTLEGGQSPVFGDFNGAVTQVIPNPDATGENTSANVVQNVVPAGAAFAGTNFPLDTNIDITTDKGFTMTVWSPLPGTPVLLKLENATTGQEAERSVTTTTTNTWETITFDFSTEGPLMFESVTVFMNFNVVDPAEQTYYWDNLEQVAITGGGGSLTAAPTPPARNAEDVISIFSDAYTDIVVDTFDTPWCPGTTTEVLIDGNPTKLVEGLGCEGVDFQSGRFDATEFTHFHMDIYTESATMDKVFNVKFSNWNGGGGEANALEFSVNNSNFLTNPNPGTWISLDIPLDDFTAITNGDRNDIVQFIISSDLGEVYYDNLYLWKEAGVATPVELPITLEGGQSPVFGDFNGAVTQVIPNPDATGENTSANVVQNAVPAGAAFAGTNFPLDTNIDITTDKMFTMNVWSPLPGTPVLLKLENATTEQEAERSVTTTTTNTWETITFDFSTEGPLTFESVTVFMNFNVVDPAEQTYYWDNLEQVAPMAAPVELPITLEGGQSPVFGDFNGAVTQVIPNPDATGENTSANVVQNVVPAGAAFAGTNFPLDTNIDIATDKGFTMTVWSPLPGTPVLLKLENATTGQEAERSVTTTTTNTWETITFDFSTEGPLTFESVTVFMNFNVVDPAEQTYYWDNLEQVAISTTGSDATLSDLQVDGATVTGFDPLITQYTIDLPAGTTVVPQITLATPTDVNATSVTITQATAVPGDANVVVVSESGMETQTYIVSFDIVLGPPMVAAPTPPARAPEDVISIFSDAYDDIIVDTFDTPWCPGSTTEILIQSNPTKVVAGLGCEGVEFITGRFDATEFTFFHIDIYTEVETLDRNFNVKFSNWDGGNAEVNSIQFSADNSNVLPSPNPGTWISIDIPLDDFNFTNNDDRNDIVQFIMSSDLGALYYDNLYLHKDTTLSTDAFSAAEFKVFPNPTSENWIISSNSTINKVTLYDVLGSKVFEATPRQEEVTITSQDISSGMYFAIIESDKGTQTVKLIKK